MTTLVVDYTYVSGTAVAVQPAPPLLPCAATPQKDRGCAAWAPTIHSRSGLELIVKSKDLGDDGLFAGLTLLVALDPDSLMILAAGTHRLPNAQDAGRTASNALSDAHVKPSIDVVIVCDEFPALAIAMAVESATGICPEVQSSFAWGDCTKVEGCTADLVRLIRAELSAFVSCDWSTVAGHEDCELIIECFVDRAVAWHNAMPFGIAGKSPVERWQQRTA